MKISYNWLQTYFDTKLPAPEKLEELFTFKAFEVEGLEQRQDDTILDLKVLPDRACYALSHRGIAGEVAAILDVAVKPPHMEELRSEIAVKPPKVSIESQLCSRYIARRIENIKVTDSPAWLRERLEVLGARSINTIVDATNYVMYDIGQPLHAFDADKVKGDITVRLAKEGEKMTTLDGKDVALKANELVIADEEGILAIAGVKGGKKAEVTKATKNIILEAAHFNPGSVRKTSTRIGIRNESSKRFENNITPDLAAVGMTEVTQLIARLSPEVKIGESVDHYKNPISPLVLTVHPQFIASVLGLTIDTSEMKAILKRLSIGVEEKAGELILTIPTWRRDLTIPEDITEEVGRIYGFEKIKGQLPHNTTFSPKVNKIFYYSEKIKNCLVELGFSEVYLYTLGNTGEYEVLYPVASDKNYLRANLASGILNCLELNARNADYLGLDTIRIFEIGKVFTKAGEHTSLALGIKQIKKKKGEKIEDEFSRVESVLKEALNSDIHLDFASGIAEINLDDLIKKLPDPTSYADVHFKKASDIRYQPISPYPYIVRDIALFIPANVSPEEVSKTLTEEKSDLLVKGPVLFDDFTNKEGKRSVAFRMIYQSFDRTLSDAEVKAIMEKIYAKVKRKGWEVR